MIWFIKTSIENTRFYHCYTFKLLSFFFQILGSILHFHKRLAIHFSAQIKITRKDAMPSVDSFVFCSNCIYQYKIKLNDF